MIAKVAGKSSVSPTSITGVGMGRVVVMVGERYAIHTR